MPRALKVPVGFEALFFDEETLEPQFGGEGLGFQERGAAFAQGDNAVWAGDGHQLVELPHGRRAADPGVTVHFPSQAGQVVAGEEDLAAAGD